MNQSNLQNNHFNKLAETYNYHYSDSLTKKYRHEIFLKKIFEGENLNFKLILDIGCGTGEMSTYIKEIYPDAIIFGLDISEENIKIYNKKFTGYSLNVVDDIIHQKKFDYIIASGLLHHVSLNLEKVLININRMLKKSGMFIFIDPNKNYILEPLRKIWYKLDKNFDDINESALSYNDLQKLNNNVGNIFCEHKLFFFWWSRFFSN